MGRKGKRGRSEDDYLMQFPMSAKRFCSQLDAFVESSPVFENFQGGKYFPQGRPMLADAIQDYAFAALQDRPDFIQRIRFQFCHHCQVKDVPCGKVGTAMPDFFAIISVVVSTLIFRPNKTSTLTGLEVSAPDTTKSISPSG